MRATIIEPLASHDAPFSYGAPTGDLMVAFTEREYRAWMSVIRGPYQVRVVEVRA